MRCPDCNKFVGMETQDPEVNDLEIDDDGRITGSVRVARSCAECGTELKEANFDIDLLVENIPLPVTYGLDEGDPITPPHEEHALDVEETSCEYTERVEGRGRGAKTFIGYRLTVAVRCGGCDLKIDDIAVCDEMQASAMDEIA